MKYFYGVLSILGLVLPYSQFIPWITHNGLDVPLLWEAITSTRIGAFAWMDVLVTVIVLLGIHLVRRHQKENEVSMAADCRYATGRSFNGSSLISVA